MSPLGSSAKTTTSFPRIPLVFLLAMTCGGIAAIHAAIESRDLNADGSYYLLTALEGDGLALIERARRSVQILQQSFAYAGQILNVRDQVVLGQLLTLGMQAWPLILTGLCWFILPAGQKGWILGPLLNLAVVIPITSFMGIGEGMIASGLMWVLFLLLEFERRGWMRLLAAMALMGAGFYVHEASFPFMISMALLAIRRGKQAEGRRRLGFYVIALLGLCAAGNLVTLILHRPGAEYGQAIARGFPFLRGLLGEFLVNIEPEIIGVNLPAVAGLAVAICLLSAHLSPRLPVERRARRTRMLCRAALLLFGVIGLLFLTVPRWITINHSYMAGRGLPIIATTLMAGGIHFLRRAGWAPERLMPSPVLGVLAAVIPLHLAIQTSMTLQWASYQRELTALVASRDGVVTWQSAADALDPRRDFFRHALVRAWSIQPLSIVLAPGGTVRSVIDVRPGSRWKPYQPEDPATLPRCVPGLDWSRYLATLGTAAPGPACGKG